MPTKRNLKEVAIEAVEKRDANLAAKVAQVLRDKGFNFEESHQLVSSWSPISLAEWDGLLYEADVTGL